MATVQTTDIITSTDAVTASTSPALLSNGDFYLAENTLIASTSGDAFSDTSGSVQRQDFVILGQVIGDNMGFEFRPNTIVSNDDHEFSFYFGENASVTAFDFHGIMVGGALPSATGFLDITNQGEIQAFAMAIYTFYLNDLTIDNTGDITSLGTTSSTPSNAIRSILTDHVDISNSGLISTKATTTSLAYTTISNVAAISLTGDSDTATIVNTGTIRGQYALFSDAKSSDVWNSGLLDGSLYFRADGTSSLRFDNAGGTVLGDITSFSTVDRITNSGEIIGDIDLYEENDVYRGRGGTVDGVIDGGDGNDLFITDQSDIQIIGGDGDDTVRAFSDFTSAGLIEEIELRGSGDFDATGDLQNNNIIGNKGRNVLNGLDGTDTITGASGNDTMFGGVGNDELLAGTGDDQLNGELDDDRLLGQVGDDEINGGNGDDTLNGGTGKDLLIGLGGKDTMLGGADDDVFLFESASHSGTTASTADRINDFATGDIIDIGSLIDEALVFNGTSGLVGGGTGSVAYTVTAGGTSRVSVDADGDGTLDMMINVIGVSSLSASDFIL